MLPSEPKFILPINRIILESYSYMFYLQTLTFPEQSVSYKLFYVPDYEIGK